MAAAAALKRGTIGALFTVAWGPACASQTDDGLGSAPDAGSLACARQNRFTPLSWRHRKTFARSAGTVRNTRKRVENMDLLQTLRTHIEFELAKIGPPGARTEGILRHIEKEIVEVRKNPSDVEEWCDIAILAFGGALRCALEKNLDIGNSRDGEVDDDMKAGAALDVWQTLENKLHEVWFRRRFKFSDNEGEPVEHIRGAAE